MSFDLQDKDKFPIQNLWIIIFIKINKLNRDNSLSLSEYDFNRNR